MQNNMHLYYVVAIINFFRPIANDVPQDFQEIRFLKM